jgi:anthranilate phosphoribosyltransferase
LGLYCADFSNDLKECAKAAEDSILSGKALQKLEQLRDFEA